MRYLTLFFLIAFAAYAADVTGTWKGSFEAPNGEREVVLKLKANGSKLTGTMTISPSLEGELEDGKIEGDKVSFIFVSGDREMECKGKVSGKEITLEMLRGQRNVPMTLKKQ